MTLAVLQDSFKYKTDKFEKNSLVINLFSLDKLFVDKLE